ncbi:MAG TPA: hypothetical protein VN903_37995 [Polyangia bacterium]|jgi:hypothetical protein|nr:hypothetical protein [Polyangia bacterium]
MRPRAWLATLSTAAALWVGAGQLIGCGSVESVEDAGSPGHGGSGQSGGNSGGGTGGSVAGRGGTSGDAGTGGGIVSGRGGSDSGMAGTGGGGISTGGRGGTADGRGGTTGMAGTGGGAAAGRGGTTGMAGTGGATGGRGGTTGMAGAMAGTTGSGGSLLGLGGLTGLGGLLGQAGNGGRGGTTGSAGTGGAPTTCARGMCPALMISDLQAIDDSKAPGFDAPGFRCKSLTICPPNGSCIYYSTMSMFGSLQSAEDTYSDGAAFATPAAVKVYIDGGAASQCNNPSITFTGDESLTLTFDGGKKVPVYLPAFMGTTLTLYVASDGSTYRDAALTMVARLRP